MVLNLIVSNYNDGLLRITADKRLWCFAPSSKLPSATSFIRKTLTKAKFQDDQMKQLRSNIKELREVFEQISVRYISEFNLETAKKGHRSV